MKILRSLVITSLPLIACALAPSPSVAAESPRRLVVLTLNTWHGLDAKGILRFGDLEDPEVRAERFKAEIKAVVELQPDLVFLQEADPPRFARVYAEALGFDEIHQVANCGIKVSGIGIPVNLREGLVILARKELQLKRIGQRKLRGSAFGSCTDHFGFQLRELRYMLAGKITIGNREALVINTHLHHGTSASDADLARARELVKRGSVSEAEYAQFASKLEHLTSVRAMEVRDLMATIERINRRSPSRPVIIGADLNARPDEREIAKTLKAYNYLDSYAMAGEQPGYSYDETKNPNARTRKMQAPLVTFKNGALRRLYDDMCAAPKRIDYILIRPSNGFTRVTKSALFGTAPVNGHYISDHFGVVSALEFD